MRTCTPKPHVVLQLPQSEVTHVAGVQFPGAAGGDGLGGRPTVPTDIMGSQQHEPSPCTQQLYALPSKTAVGPGGGGARLGLLWTSEEGEGRAAGVVGADVAAGVGDGVGDGV